MGAIWSYRNELWWIMMEIVEVSDLVAFHGGFNGILMGFYGDLAGVNGDFSGISLRNMVIVIEIIELSWI